MQNSDKKGIICDLCQMIYSNKFKYYNATFDMIDVDCSLNKASVIDVDKRFLDLDICENCMNEMIEKVKLGIKKRANKSTWSAGS